jgi:hypothetical protein
MLTYYYNQPLRLYRIDILRRPSQFPSKYSRGNLFSPIDIRRIMQIALNINAFEDFIPAMKFSRYGRLIMYSGGISTTVTLTER